MPAANTLRWLRLVRVAATLLCVLAIGTGAWALPAGAQSRSRRKHKIPKHKPAQCLAGCGPQTTAPELTSPSAEDEAAQRELAGLARALRNAAPGAYAKLAEFA